MKVTAVPFSKKQLQVLTWWHPNSPVSHMNGIIADGAIRAGKTYPFGISFIEWAFHFYDGQNFAICGKSVGAARRNIVKWLLPTLNEMGYMTQDIRSENMIVISRGERSNTFYVFGGKDERSQDLIQGLTLAGILLDEVALMPQSFVNQATGRCSVSGAKQWFNCNPASPSHWFKRELLDNAHDMKMIHLHFTMQDNPSLDQETKDRLYGQYRGIFFKRMILGQWVVAEGAIYDQINENNFYDELPLREHNWAHSSHYISCDYGTQNATVFLHIIDDGKTVWVENEYYHSGRDETKLGTGTQKSDTQYADDLEAYIKGKPISQIILDPSAASFQVELQNRGHWITDADNEVLDGIRMVASALALGIIKINEKNCPNLIRELQSYVWDAKPTEKGKEQPLKRDDHGPDALRYFVKTILQDWRLVA